MTEKDLQQYVSDQMAKGINPDVLRMALESEGVSESEFDAALNSVNAKDKVTLPEALTRPTPAPTTILPEEPKLVQAPVVPTKPFIPQMKLPSSRFHVNKYAVIGLVLLLLLGAGGVYAYNEFFITPERIAAKALQKTADVKSFDFDGSFKLELKFPADSFTGNSGDEPGALRTIKGEMIFSGTSDLRDANNPKSRMDIKISGEGMTMSLETRSIGEEFYVKLNEFPALGLFDAGSIREQWIKIDRKALSEYSGLEQTEESSSELTADQLNKLQETYIRYPVFNLGEKLPSEKIDGTGTHHFSFSIDKANASKFVLDLLNNIYAEKTADYKEEIESGLDQFLNSFTLTNSEVWIGKWDYLPRRLALTGVFVAKEQRVSATSAIVFNQKNYNKSTEITAPDNARGFEEVIEEVTGSTFESTYMKARDARRLAEIRQIMTALELYYNDNGGYPPAGNGRPHPTQGVNGGVADISFNEYLPEMPANPTPVGDNCADYPTYVYTRASADEYALTFCLELESGGFAAGVHTATQSGIE